MVYDMKDKAAIVGIGWTEISRNSGASVLHLAVDACKRAVEDAGLTIKDIDGIVTHNMSDSVMPQQVANCFGIPQLAYHLEYWGGGPAGGQTIMNAALAVATGLAKYVVCFRALNGRSGRRIGGIGEKPKAQGVEQFAIPYGFTNFTHLAGICIGRHMIKYGTTERQIGSVVVNQRNNAMLNERAIQRKPLTMEEYLNSKKFTDHIRFYDICSEVDGGVAVVVTTAERARDLKKRPVYISGMAAGGGPAQMSYGMNTADLSRWPDLTESFIKYIAPSLYHMAGVTPQDIDIAELYDDVSLVVLMQLEDFGFCKPGEAGAFAEEGGIKIGGKLPVNTHGGLICEGYLHGINNITEAVSQLRGEAGQRQVENAQLAVTSHFALSLGSALILRRG